MPLNFRSFKVRRYSLYALVVSPPGAKGLLSVFLDFELSFHWRGCKMWRFGAPKILLTK
jgi:hypothetical protein